MFTKKVKSVGTISEFLGRSKADKALNVVSVGKRITHRELFNMGMLGGFTLPLALGGKIALADGVDTPPPVISEVVAVTAQQKDSTQIYDSMVHAFDPLIDIIQALAYPIAMVVVLGGALFIMIGNKEKGFSMMQGAGLGYVLVQLTPMVLNILVSAMKAV